MRLALVAAIAGGIVVAALVAMYVSRLPSSDYSLKVDALKDEQSMGLHTLEMDPRMDPLRDDTRFDRVRGKVMSAATTH